MHPRRRIARQPPGEHPVARTQRVFRGWRELAEAVDRPAAKLFADQVHDEGVDRVEADAEAAGPRLPVAEIGPHGGLVFGGMGRPQKMAQFMDQNFQPLGFRDALAPFADQNVGAERPRATPMWVSSRNALYCAVKPTAKRAGAGSTF